MALVVSISVEWKVDDFRMGVNRGRTLPDVLEIPMPISFG
eukprot:CAMPEP_0196179454 /NCGR_PEP_ID=MMETSP0911-20130528/20801_1 /TAXON_ID=49265 /ORGANISM="Thalassiosira rotula, Strain GSO102" /LENGTH=39 /DNA_ID= /DNA_START= /DNA_END= /DNA_ORIENTATION=